MTIATEAPAAPAPINPAQANTPVAPAATPAAPAEANPGTPTPNPAPVAPATVPTLGEDGTPLVDPSQPTSADADADGVITYQPTGDTGMDMALEFVGRLGLGMDDPAMLATVNGDWSLLEAKLATMGDEAKGWERMLDLAKAADARFAETRAVEAAAINTAISSVLGESEADILAWAGKEATEEERASINAMFRADPVQARAASLLLLSLYEQGAGNTVIPASATRDGSGSDPAQGDRTPITRSQFAVEAGKLHKQYGAAYTQTTEYAALSARVR